PAGSRRASHARCCSGTFFRRPELSLTFHSLGLTPHMDDPTFWQIIEETHHSSMEENEQRLYERLSKLSEDEILEFERLTSLRYWELYSWELWGVAHLYWGGCSDDSFMDWRHWIISCGKEVFETARDYPDDLVAAIDAHPDAGCEGISYIPMRVLREKNPKWEDTSPTFDILRPENPRGKDWEEDDLKELLPKSYKRFREHATEQEQRMKDPSFGVRLGEEHVFTLNSEDIEIGGQKATRTQFIPVKKKPWWKLW
ncbi:MAG: DUF4240 domain-containing protein, partial [Verrucomicrobiota bacterium]|nr:DUF4240 domain-containing protein [Verrucomicrobiota bacterium]